MRYGHIAEEGSLPVFSVNNTMTARKLLIMACPTNIRGEFVSPELAAQQDYETLCAFGKRLNELYERYLASKDILTDKQVY